VFSFLLLFILKLLLTVPDVIAHLDLLFTEIAGEARDNGGTEVEIVEGLGHGGHLK
jgi:hypothetical protein